jgi:hypothetical protein
MEIGNMSNKLLTEALKEIMARGTWETEKELMGEVLKTFPHSFNGLYEVDALRVIDYGNSILNGIGVPAVYINPDDIPTLKPSAGKCVDLWDDGNKRLRGGFTRRNTGKATFLAVNPTLSSKEHFLREHSLFNSPAPTPHSFVEESEAVVDYKMPISCNVEEIEIAVSAAMDRVNKTSQKKEV